MHKSDPKSGALRLCDGNSTRGWADPLFWIRRRLEKVGTILSRLIDEQYIGKENIMLSGPKVERIIII